MKPKIKIDWQQLCLNLRRHGSLQQLSLKHGWNKAYLNELARFEIREPKFSDGLYLLNLHLDLCGQDKHQNLLIK